MANKNEMATVSQTLLGANDKGRVTYQVAGEDINLSFQIVRNFLTRGNGGVTDGEIIQFISLCKANKLNPFIGEAWLVKYDAKTPAQMLTARDAFMKRAEESPVYEGYRSGVIVQRDKEVLYLEGAFYLAGDTLLGGWAEVHRSDRKFPTIQRVRLQEYNSGRSTWAQKPGTMIQKVAEAHAFRKAFPMVMSGLYTPEEVPEVQPQQEGPKEAENAARPQFQEEQPAQELPAPAEEPAPAQEPAQETKEDKLPWEDQGKPEPAPVPVETADEQDPNMDLFNAE